MSAVRGPVSDGLRPETLGARTSLMTDQMLYGRRGSSSRAEQSKAGLFNLGGRALISSAVAVDGHQAGLALPGRPVRLQLTILLADS